MSNQPSTLEILNPRREIKLADGRFVTVRELPWLRLKNLLATIAEKLASVSGLVGAGAQSIELSRVTQLIQDSEDLVEFIIGHTTTLTAEEIGGLSITETFAILDVALELNVTSLQGGAKKAFGRITSFAAKPLPGTATATPTSA